MNKTSSPATVKAFYIARAKTEALYAPGTLAQRAEAGMARAERYALDGERGLNAHAAKLARAEWSAWSAELATYLADAASLGAV